MLGHLTVLETLHGVVQSDIPALPSAPVTPPFQLLDFMAHYEVGDDFLHLILYHSRQSLTRLELIDVWWPSGEALDLSPYVALMSLSLRINVGWPICYDDGGGGVLNTIKTCRILTHLKLWGDESGEEPNDEEPFLRHLPSTLSTLVLDGIWAPYADLILDLAESTNLPSLRQLTLNDVTQPHKEGSEVEEDGELV